jgi:hypothetical protein
MSFVVGPFALDQERRQLLQSGEPVPLETEASKLLALGQREMILAPAGPERGPA